MPFATSYGTVATMRNASMCAGGKILSVRLALEVGCQPGMNTNPGTRFSTSCGQCGTLCR